MPTTLGDLDGDGLVNVYDLTRLRSHIRGTAALPQNLVPFADVTVDGFINEDDAVALINTITGRNPAKSLPLASVRETSPYAGEGTVALTREVIMRFSQPLSLNASLTTWDANTQTPGNFYAEGGGRKLLTRVELSGDRTKATLFFLEPVPASTRVTVTFDGTGVNDLLERPLDPEGDSAAGGTLKFTYDTAPITAVAGTGIIGHVYASERGAGGVNVPIAGVLVRVVGSETLFTHTLADGSFSLNPCPTGRFFVEVDGRTSPASNFPSGNYFPSVSKVWEALPGRADNLAAGVGNIFLPRVSGAARIVASPTQTTIVTTPALPGVELSVPANTLFSDDGTRGGSVVMAPVAPDRLPEPLPPGLNFAQVITIQTDGATNFDRPVPVKFPNLPDPVTGKKLNPGEKSALWSFNHDKGTWEIVGPMTVSDDGAFAVSDVGVGIRQPGWHGTQPGVALNYKGTKLGPAPQLPCPPIDDINAVLYSPYRVPKLGPTPPPNGCGPENGNVRLAMDIILIPFQHEFKEACNEHDLGYSTYVPQEQFVEHKKRVDDKFRDDMRIVVLRLAALRQIPELLIPVYLAAAEIYALAVRRLGDEFFASAQAEVSGLSCPPESHLVNKQAITNSKNGPSGLQCHFLLNANFSETEFRGKSLADQDLARLVLSPYENYTLLVVEPRANLIGTASFFTFRSGSTVQVDSVYLEQSLSPDSDLDGLLDDVESVLGTNPSAIDSDSDEIPDGAEIAQGTDPLSGIPVATGVVASIDTPGYALDVAALNGLAAIADQNAGVAIFNVASTLNPIRVAQVDTNGTAKAVAMNSSKVAVADGPSGLAVVDISTPANARLVGQYPFGSAANAVSLAGSLAYVGLANGQVVVFDVEAEVELDRISLPDSPVHDLTVLGEVLYVVAANSLHAIPLDVSPLAVSSTVGFSGGVGAGGRRLRISAGDGLLHVTVTNGYNIFSVANPSQPTFVRRETTGQFGWKQIVTTGSGLGLAAVGANSTDDGTHDVSLYDLRPNGTTTQFLTTFQTPGLAEAVAIYNGVAYVADGPAGLSVVNYRAYDALGVPPTIALSKSWTGGAVDEGSSLRVTASVSDDVQVRNVEFYVNDQLVETDGGFPFEFRFSAPLLASGATSISVRARATDTGGNSTWSETLTANLRADSTPPVVTRFRPPQGSISGRLRNLSLTFNEPMAADSLSNASIKVVAAGPDRRLGSSDDFEVSGGVLDYRAESRTVFISFPQHLAAGNYRISSSSPAADRAGNVMVSPRTSDFRVFDFTDADADGVPDELEAAIGLNPNNPDSDGNGIRDGDEDGDHDGVKNAFEFVLGTDPTRFDTDGNGIGDADEDADGDGLATTQEFTRGTDPASADSDGDGWDDGGEIADHADPLNSGSTPKIQVVGAASYFNGFGEPDFYPVGRTIFSPLTTYENQTYSNQEPITVVSPVISFRKQ